MSLSLLAPLALALGTLVVLPMIAHMARQTPRDRQSFGAMLLLERVVKRLRRRRRVKDPLLLLLRAAAVLALVLAVAAPRFSFPGTAPEFGGSGRVVLVIDRSLSMQLLDGGATLLQRAREEAARVVSGLPPGATVGLVIYDSEALALTTELTTDHASVLARIQSVEPSHGTSNLRAALLEARRLLEGEEGEVLVFTDEAGPHMISDAAVEIERLIEGGSSVIPRPIAADPPRNVSILHAEYGDGLEGGQVTIRIANHGPDPVEIPCEVSLPDGAVIPIFSDVPPQGEAEERITVPANALGGVGVASCVDADLPHDDQRWFHLPRVGASRVLVVDGDPGDTPIRSEVYFLERALAPWGTGKGGISIDVTTPAGLRELDPQRHRVVFLANVADPRPFGPLLVDFVRKGGNLVISAGNNVTADRYNAALASVLPSRLRDTRSVADAGETGIPVALPDTSHELFAPFARAGRGSFTRIRSHTLLTFEPYEDVPDEVATLLRYENGMPALVQRTIGAGRVIVWTSTFDHAWSNLPLQSAFMPIVQRLVDWLGGEAGGGTERVDALVGQPITVQLPDTTIEPVVLGPRGEEVRSRIEGSRVLFTPEQPGAYRVGLADAPPLAWVAVNHDPVESDVRRYASIAGVEREIAPELLERHVDLSRPLLGFGLLLLVGQALLAMRGGS